MGGEAKCRFGAFSGNGPQWPGASEHRAGHVGPVGIASWWVCSAGISGGLNRGGAYPDLHFNGSWREAGSKEPVRGHCCDASQRGCCSGSRATGEEVGASDSHYVV